MSCHPRGIYKCLVRGEGLADVQKRSYELFSKLHGKTGVCRIEIAFWNADEMIWELPPKYFQTSTDQNEQRKKQREALKISQTKLSFCSFACQPVDILPLICLTLRLHLQERQSRKYANQLKSAGFSLPPSVLRVWGKHLNFLAFLYQTVTSQKHSFVGLSNDKRINISKTAHEKEIRNHQELLVLLLLNFIFFQKLLFLCLLLF